MNLATTFDEPAPVSPDHEPMMFDADALTDEAFASLDSDFGDEEYDADEHGSAFNLSEAEAAMLGITFSAPKDPGTVASAMDAKDKAGKMTQHAADLIADSLKALPMKEREQIVKELYGIADTFPPPKYGSNSESTSQYTPQDEDDPIFIGHKLKEMEEQLKKIRAVSAWNLRIAAIELAESQNPEYVQNAKFRLKFIRTERYDVRRAAARFIRFFDLKMELFGAEALTRPITLKDLKPGDREMLKKGYIQRLPVRDRAGRAIYASLYNGQTYDTPESLVRIYFYVACTDEETDKRGTISVFFKLQDIQYKSCSRAFGGCLYTGRLATDLPFRADFVHKFLENEDSSDLGTKMMHKVVDYVIGIMVPEIKVRTRIHHGTYDDWAKELMSYGIPHDLIPFTYNCKIKTKNHQEYLAMRSKAEEIIAQDPSTNPDTLIDLPTRSDVLLGKGKPIQFSSGNQRLMTIIDGYLDQYHNHCSKQEKTELTFEIVRMLKDSGVRFLSKDSGIWLEVSDELARGKISYMFRHQRGRTPTTNGATGLVRPAPAGEELKTGITDSNDTKRIKVGV
ncbi:Transfer protein [Seminavis robusta]|uniref:Transfer protein n=1 Tax=Seminavis robusta TaxID=568900 RepID=A0A9N8EX18_9STRA|nr:Transfer protein [Seminavis robusta]|eukprot:Sro1856_g302010.1 Transfer protein (566) ;mRNA; r:15159-17031